MKEEIKNCSQKIYTNRGFSSHFCSKKVVITANGKNCCKVHSPEYIELKDKKAEEDRDKRTCKCGHVFERPWEIFCMTCGTERHA